MEMISLEIVDSVVYVEGYTVEAAKIQIFRNYMKFLNILKSSKSNDC